MNHTADTDTLLKAIDDKKARIGVVGLGYVGLPLSKTFLDAGFECLGFDLDEKKIQQLEAGKSYIKHIEGSWIARQVEAGSFQVTSDMQRLSEADVILICVPTPLADNRQPDLSFVEGTARSIASTLRPGQLIILESTTYPGTTREILLPILEQEELKAGDDFYLAYSPEREDPGNPDFSTAGIPKVVGGIEPNSLRLAEALYSRVVVETVPVSSCEIAEACKILENTYRSVNIAMVNELKMLFQRIDIDIWEVIDAARTKPFGFEPFYPGPGLGGHCIPIDPFYLSWLAKRHQMATRFIELAGDVNSGMPAHVISRLEEALADSGKQLAGSRIGILGVAYKPNVDDPRESPAFKLMELLEAAGATISYNDPHIPVLPSMRSFQVPRLTSEELTPGYLSSLDCLLIVTDHDAYDWEMVAEHAPLVVDTRNALGGFPGREKIWKA
ncbi:MAG: nucleotide sugar dehydrogenase [Planctomycetota bacterium]|nr:nucleotide sugar dehydrogenase [Planctomycetota bacterium]